MSYSASTYNEEETLQPLLLCFAMMCYGSPRCCIISSTIFGVNLRVPVFHPSPCNAVQSPLFCLIQSLNLRRADETELAGKYRDAS